MLRAPYEASLSSPLPALYAKTYQAWVSPRGVCVVSGEHGDNVLEREGGGKTKLAKHARLTGVQHQEQDDILLPDSTRSLYWVKDASPS